MSDSSTPPLGYIQKYLASEHNIPLGDLGGARTFESLDLDSIAQVEMFVTLSDHYRIELDDSLASADMTLDQTADMVEEALLEKAAVPRQEGAADNRANQAHS
ncbi:acyl carrier protein [Streptomyces sp. NPDC047014]|uniref:acyl carrier protein n=1 Tax=Streptomyces sp. NPDC047014 TaxID=3155736 RepID=UPI0033EEDAE7